MGRPSLVGVTTRLPSQRGAHAPESYHRGFGLTPHGGIPPLQGLEDVKPWRFLVDENLHPPIATYLGKEEIHAAYVPDALFEGADDDDDVLPFARAGDYILVTNDLRDFGNRDPDEHEGIVLVYDGTLHSLDIVAGLLDIVETYGDRDSLRGYEVLDAWL